MHICIWSRPIVGLLEREVTKIWYIESCLFNIVAMQYCYAIIIVAHAILLSVAALY